MSPGSPNSSPPDAAPPTNDREVATLARALGHPARVEILRHLIERGDCICGQIVEVMPLAQATVSQHLKVLKEAGLIRGTVDGPRVCYCANPEPLEKLGEQLIELARSGKRGVS